LKDIHTQAEETAKATQAMRDSIPFQQQAADAALLNARAVIGAECARLAIDIELSQLLGNVEFKDSGSVAHFIVTCRNCGKTPAWIYEMLEITRLLRDSLHTLLSPIMPKRASLFITSIPAILSVKISR
jgi:hypothetical protein